MPDADVDVDVDADGDGVEGVKGDIYSMHSLIVLSSRCWMEAGRCRLRETSLGGMQSVEKGEGGCGGEQPARPTWMVQSSCDCYKYKYTGNDYQGAFCLYPGRPFENLAADFRDGGQGYASTMVVAGGQPDLLRLQDTGYRLHVTYRRRKGCDERIGEHAQEDQLAFWHGAATHAGAEQVGRLSCRHATCEGSRR